MSTIENSEKTLEIMSATLQRYCKDWGTLSIRLQLDSLWDYFLSCTRWKRKNVEQRSSNKSNHSLLSTVLHSIVRTRQGDTLAHPKTPFLLFYSPGELVLNILTSPWSALRLFYRVASRLLPDGARQSRDDTVYVIEGYYLHEPRLKTSNYMKDVWLYENVKTSKRLT